MWGGGGAHCSYNVLPAPLIGLLFKLVNISFNLLINLLSFALLITMLSPSVCICV